MRRWLDQFVKISDAPPSGTDRTDKTAPDLVSSVSSVSSSAIFETPIVHRTVSSVLSVPSLSVSQIFDREGWDDEDWQALFDERAAILEYDEGLSRSDAARLARQQVDQQRKGL